MQNESEDCRINRWDVLKQKLNNLKPGAFQKAISQEDGHILIDCRRREEFLLRHLPSARNIDYLAYNFLDDLEQLDPEKTYLVYCRSGRRSIRTCTLMQNSGFKKVYNLDGGLNAWEQEFGLNGLLVAPENDK